AAADPAAATARTRGTTGAGAAPSGTGSPSMVVLAGYRQPQANTNTGHHTDHDIGYYVVRRGDTLSSIARGHLGDANRWPEICDLNWHRHFPTVGGTLRDCDLIYPGWDLALPADAQPPTGAVPAPPPTPPSPPPPSA